MFFFLGHSSVTLAATILAYNNLLFLFSMLIASCPEAQGCMSAVNKYLQQCHAYTSMFMHVFFSLSPDFSSGEET